MSRVLKLAIPNKGRLSDDAVQILKRAGLSLRGSSERQLFATTLGGRVQVLFLRAKDIPEFVSEGSVDAGITGRDAVAESGLDLLEHLDLGFGACRLVLAVPEASAARTARDLPADVRVATSYPLLTRRYFEANDKKVRIVPVTGACEVTPTLGVAEAITDLTSTGSTLAQNHLREVDTLLESSCVFVTRPKADDGDGGAAQGADVADLMERVVFALRSVIAARGKRYLLADLPRSAVGEVRAFLPGLAGPTVVDIAGDKDMVAIQVVVDEEQIFDATQQLRALGGRGILVVPIDRMVPE